MTETRTTTADALASLAADVAALDAQITALEDQRAAAERELLTKMAVAIDDGELRAAEDAYFAVRDVVGPQWPQTWRETMPAPVGAFANRASHRRRWDRRSVPNGPGGHSWVGTLPISMDDPMPPPGVAVVYVLYGATGEPVYLGSSDRLRDRLSQHERDRKQFTAWMAYPCSDREAAYALEDRHLAAKPLPLNIRLGR